MKTFTLQYKECNLLEQEQEKRLVTTRSFFMSYNSGCTPIRNELLASKADIASSEDAVSNSRDY